MLPDGFLTLQDGRQVKVQEPSYGAFVQAYEQDSASLKIPSVLISLCTGLDVAQIDALPASDGLRLHAACIPFLARIQKAIGESHDKSTDVRQH